MSGRITLSTDAAGICTVTIDNPGKRNAIDAEMWSELSKFAPHLDADLAVKVVIFTGSGTDAFAAGADISEFTEKRNGPNAASYDRVTEQAVNAIASISKPTISSIRGFCMGGGVNLILATDIRIASETSIFAVPPARLGIAYPISSLERLVSSVGEQNAKYLLYTARRIDAERARSIGLVADVSEEDRLDDEVRQVAEQISQNAPLSIAAAKLGVSAIVPPTGLTENRSVIDAAELCYRSEDYAEGIKAFLERRRPHFQGR